MRAFDVEAGYEADLASRWILGGTLAYVAIFAGTMAAIALAS